MVHSTLNHSRPIYRGHCNRLRKFWRYVWDYYNWVSFELFVFSQFLAICLKCLYLVCFLPHVQTWGRKQQIQTWGRKQSRYNKFRRGAENDKFRRGAENRLYTKNSDVGPKTTNSDVRPTTVWIQKIQTWGRKWQIQTWGRKPTTYIKFRCGAENSLDPKNSDVGPKTV